MEAHYNKKLNEHIKERAEELLRDGKTEGLVSHAGVDLRVFIGKANAPKEILLQFQAGQLLENQAVFIGSNQKIGV